MGKYIIEHQAVAFMLADMAIAAEAARGLVWCAAWAKDAGHRNSKWCHDVINLTTGSSIPRIGGQNLRKSSGS